MSWYAEISMIGSLIVTGLCGACNQPVHPSPFVSPPTSSEESPKCRKKALVHDIWSFNYWMPAWYSNCDACVTRVCNKEQQPPREVCIACRLAGEKDESEANWVPYQSNIAAMQF
ncbi:hypothetical protein FN846DRAFT_46015 [Sphaerosporella brunnea]|uniref:RanBP2-type domain-containing protein n=1 Tax=Sphaerosporella brunnea TaxID=1250544 RepID=A0A5J5EUU6_9PEZI|nr:hypothetical protein FN846DRAFT_46015 [Sphaerosporella brunnea]